TGAPEQSVEFVFFHYNGYASAIKYIQKILDRRFWREYFELGRHRFFDRIIKMRRIAVHFHKHIGFIDNPKRMSILIDHGKLRDIRVTHALERGQQCVRRPDGNYFAGLVTMRDQIDQIAMRRTMNETLLR